MASVEMIVKGANGNLVKQPIAAPVGSVIAFAADAVPTHCLACNGAAISRTAYPELFAVIGTTYGAGDGVNTFNLPNIDGVVYGVSSGRAVGAQLTEGLPNITGTVSIHRCGVANNGTFTGAFYNPNLGEAGKAASASPDFTNSTFGIDASLSNALYGASARVQPKGVVMKYCIIFE